MTGMKLTRRTKQVLAGTVLGAILGAGVLVACGPNGAGGQAIAERSGGEVAGEHGAGGEGAGGEGGAPAAGSEEASGATLAPDATFDAVRSGARLILNYNAAQQAFTGTVPNTTSNVLGQVRIEVHLSNGVELGPTTPVDLQPGQAIPIELPSTTGSFTGWIAHAEVGSGGEGGQAGGEGSGGEGAGGEGHGAGGEGGGEGGTASAEAAREAAMSSPITPLDQPWTGVLGGIAVDARYDAATQTIHTTVRNALGQKQCYVQVEPHLKAGAQTVGELGPGQVGDLNPGQQATSSLGLASEPNLAGVAFDGYVIHVEVFDCGGPGPVPHSGGDGGQGSGGEGAGGEGHGPGGEGGSEGSGGEGSGAGGAAGSEEGSGANLALDETFDAVRGGARLILAYDAASNAFTGTVANTTGGILRQVRIEVHLSNGVELGPTTPVDLQPGQVLAVELPATAAPFTGWIAHAEVGSGGEAGGEHGAGSQGGEGGGEHGGGREGGGGEHGGRGEGRSGG
ncbi:MAG: hypothetical protein OXR64_06680 [Chloroflexota bacterium]|nr:hypothetical protein [Chloroflexota bacterium]